MKAERPVNLNLMKFHFPPMAILSICHRITGVLLFLFTPFALYLLQRTMHSADHFEHIKNLLSHNLAMQFAVWLMASCTLFHFIAGLRHLLMDLGFWESVRAGRISSFTVFTLVLIGMIFLGVWIW